MKYPNTTTSDHKNAVMEALKSLVGKDEESLKQKEEWFAAAHDGDIEKMNAIYKK